MPRVVDHEAYRFGLLRDSLEVVARVGYGSLSMKQLAKSLKVSTGLIYHYFENKEDWFASLVVQYSAGVFERLTQEVTSTAPLPERAKLLLEHIDRHKDDYANLISVASDYARMPGAEKKEGTVALATVGDRLYEFMEALFETDKTTARTLVSHLIGVVVTIRLDARGLVVAEQLPYIQSLLACRKGRAFEGGST